VKNIIVVVEQMEPMREQLLDGEVKTILSTTFEIRAV